MANLVANSGFEFDSDGDGLADGWSRYDLPVTTLDPTARLSGVRSQKVVGAAGKVQDIRATPIYVTAGQPYYLSIGVIVQALAGGGKFVLKVEWLNIVDSPLAAHYDQRTTALPGTWQTMSVTATAPAGAVWARLICALEGGGTVNLDQIMLAQASAAVPYEAAEGAPVIPLNLVDNSGFEWDSNSDGLADGWSPYNPAATSGFTFDTAVKLSGSASQGITVAAGATQDIRCQPIAVTAGTACGLTASARVPTLSAGAKFVLKVEWLDTSYTVLDYAYSQITAASGTWQLLTVLATAPTSTRWARVIVGIEGGGSANVDAVMFAPAAAVPRYNLSMADWAAQAIFPAGSPTGAPGAIAWYIDRLHVRPYEAGFCALGFAAAYRASGVQRFADAIWTWCGWYRDHMEPDGTMYDYNVTGSTLTKLGTRDSTDSYAALYLLALRAANLVDPRPLSPFAASIPKALDAIALTQQADGLTWALPNYRVKFLMDQVETGCGLLAAAELATALANTAVADRARLMAARLKGGIDGWWNPAAARGPAYFWAEHESGVRDVIDWTSYGAALQQMWAVIFGAADVDRADQIVRRFTAAHPEWSHQETVHRYDTLVALGLAQAGYTREASAGQSTLTQRTLALDRGWDFNPMKAGWWLLHRHGAADLLLDLTLAPPPPDPGPAGILPSDLSLTRPPRSWPTTVCRRDPYGLQQYA